MRSASQPISVMVSGVPVSVCAPSDMVAQAGRGLRFSTPRRIQLRVCFAQTNPAGVAFDEMFPQFDDVRDRQPFANQKEGQFIGGDVLAWRNVSLKDVENED